MTLTWRAVHNREGQYNLDFRQGPSATFRRLWLVAAPAGTSEQTILGDSEAPKLGEELSEGSGIYCVQVRATPVGQTLWHVEAEYTTPGREEYRRRDPNPLNWAARIRWSAVVMRMPVWYDRDGNPILNTAGEPFDPPLEVDRKLPVVEVRVNMPYVPSWILGYREAINSTAWYIDGLIVAEKCAMMDSIEVSEVQVVNNIAYREVAYRAVIAPTLLGWQPRILNAGYSALVGSAQDKQLVPIVINGTTPSHPVPLDRHGRRIYKPTPENVVWLTFNVYPELDFNVLPR